MSGAEVFKLSNLRRKLNGLGLGFEFLFLSGPQVDFYYYFLPGQCYGVASTFPSQPRSEERRVGKEC